MRIGVISDTHNFLDPKIPELFKGVHHILHAGDIGLPWVLAELELVAPVTAVAGNTDDPALRYAPSKTIEFAGRKFFIQHIVHPQDREDRRPRYFAAQRPDAVIFGHTHKRFLRDLRRRVILEPRLCWTAKVGLGTKRRAFAL
jgi:hypothetical protein